MEARHEAIGKFRASFTNQIMQDPDPTNRKKIDLAQQFKNLQKDLVAQKRFANDSNPCPHNSTNPEVPEPVIDTSNITVGENPLPNPYSRYLKAMERKRKLAIEREKDRQMLMEREEELLRVQEKNVQGAFFSMKHFSVKT